MPRNIHGGSKAKKGSNKTGEDVSLSNNEFVEKSKDGTTVYGKIIRKLGCGFVDVFTEEKKMMRCSIRGKFMKKSKSWGLDDVVIVDKMTCATNDSKGMIVYHLSNNQVQMLKKRGDINSSSFAQKNEKIRERNYMNNDDDEDEFQFEDDNDLDDEIEGIKLSDDSETDDMELQNPNRPGLYKNVNRRFNKNRNNEDSEDSENNEEEEDNSDLDLDDI